MAAYVHLTTQYIRVVHSNTASEVTQIQRQMPLATHGNTLCRAAASSIAADAGLFLYSVHTNADGLCPVVRCIISAHTPRPANNAQGIGV